MSLAEIPQAVRQAIDIAPVDPQFNGPIDTRVKDIVNTTIESWQNANRTFKREFTQLEEGIKTEFSQNEADALRLYLATAAITIAGNYDYPQSKESRKDEAKAGITLFRHLKDTAIKTEAEAYLKTRDIIFKRKKGRVSVNLPEYETATITPENPLGLTESLKGIKTWLSEVFDVYISKKFVPEMRSLQDLFFKVQKEKPAESKYLFNLTLGDISLDPNNIEPEFRDLPERLGFSGKKLRRIDEREREYKILLKRAKVNITGYQPKPVGWEGLINKGEDYLNHFGLNGYIPEGKFIAMGGSDGMQQALMTARATLQAEKTKKYRKKSTFNPDVIIPTPGFMMMKDVADQLKMKTIELKTQPEQNFLPTPSDLRRTLRENKKAKIIVMTPINNPGAHVADAAKMKELLDVLNEEEFKDVIVINDLAYLGTGDTEENQGLGSVLNERKRRIDVVAWTKLIGEPGLRCATAATPDPDIAKYVIPIAKTKTLAVSFAMQARAMATLDFVKFQDMFELKRLYKYRQDKLIELLNKRKDLFDFENRPTTYWDAALYAYVPIKEGLNPLKVIAATGLFGTPAGAFYFYRLDPSLPNYMRFAVGVTPMTDENLKKMEHMMMNVPDPTE